MLGPRCARFLGDGPSKHVPTRVSRIPNSIFDKTANFGMSLADTVPANPMIIIEPKF